MLRYIKLAATCLWQVTGEDTKVDANMREWRLIEESCNKIERMTRMVSYSGERMPGPGADFFRELLKQGVIQRAFSAIGGYSRHSHNPQRLPAVRNH